MKKLFLAILFSAVLFIGFPFYNVNAMEVTYDVPFSAVPDLADLFLGILSGAQYDLSDVSTLEEAAEKHKSSLQQGYHFLQKFSTKLWNKFVTEAGIGNDSITESTDFPIQVSINDLAAFMGYNINWWEREQINDNPYVVTPDTSYLNQLNHINKFSFPPVSNDGTFYASTGLSIYDGVNYGFNGYGYSYVGNISDNYVGSFSQTFNTNSYFSVPSFACIPLSSIYITSNNNTYTYYFTFTTSNFIPNTFIVNNNGYSVGGLSYYPANWYNPDFRNMVTVGSSYSSQSTYVRSYTGTLSDVLDNISYYFRNVFIYVDGVLWSIPGSLAGDDDYITAPDVYGVGDLGLDIYDVFFPKTDDYAGFSFNGFLEWLKGQLGNKDIGLDDLIEDAPDIIITVDENNEPTTRPITYDDTRPVPIIIDGDITDDPDPDNPTPTPTPDPTTFPLPPFPKFPIPSDIPNANIQHTVLAEIIEATDNVVPQDLMILIWSTFSLMIIGGIIYILHK